ncbi:MAG TPA: hypothetical protein PK156_40300, partial [Polyangium sp.]|nr:hypothetical protein [Polyangium sp.]
RCASMLGKAYLQDPENEAAPLFINLTGATPDWDLLLFQHCPGLDLEPLRLAIGCDMVIPLLDGLERLNLPGDTVLRLPNFMTESFGPHSRVITSCTNQFHETMCNRGLLPRPDGGWQATVSIFHGYPPVIGRGSPNQL